MTYQLSRRLLLSATAATLPMPFIHRARAAGERLKLGCLTDMNGPYAALTGKGSVGSIKLAIEDFNKLHPDIPVDLVVADFSLKADVGLSILKGWLDTDGVDAVLDFPLSPLALASGRVFEEKNKVGLITSAATSEITRSGCGPNHVQFASDTFALAASLVKAIVQKGGDSWYFVMPNYELGKSMVNDASRAVTEAGGKVVGTVTYAFPGTTDFSSFLLGAQSSGAKVICLANAGDDLTNTMKQAREFSIPSAGGIIAAPFLGEPTLHTLGLQAAQGIYFSSPFYWDKDPGTRAFSERLVAIVPDQRPNKNFANAYAGAFHYLKVAATMGVAAAKADGRAVVREMKATPLEDSLFGRSSIRQDGMVLHDMLLLHVKSPAQSRETWDLCDIAATLPANQAARPINEGGCKLVHS